MLSIPERIEFHSRTSPSSTAISDIAGNRISYASLHHQVCAMADALTARGIGPEDKIALVMPDGPEMALCFLAVLRVCACAPLNPRYKEGDFRFYLDDLEAKAVLLPEGMESSVLAIADERKIPVWRIRSETKDQAINIFLDGDAVMPSGTECAPPNPAATALILHTSGTTSRPKMVPLSHENLATSAANVAGVLELTPADTGLVVMPLFHIHGLVGALLSSIHAGARVVCTPGFNGDAFLDWARTHAITWYSAVPTMHQAVLDRCAQETDAVKAIHLRLIRSSSASLPPAVFEALNRVFQAPVIESYGMTEAAHQMTSNPLGLGKQAPGSVGIPAGPEVSVMDAAGKPLDPGQKGPVYIRGKNVTQGYLNNETANRESFVDGWFCTGDEGYFDASGYLYLTGRLKEMINRGGENIAPREIDEALLEHPAVAQATAFAIPHPSLSEDVAAAVILAPGTTATESELRSFLAGKLTDFKVPTRIIFVDSIPKGPTGKLQRIGLHEKLWDQLQTRYEAPVSDFEKLVVRALEEILDHEKIGIDDNFFFMGGDSIRATRVLNRLKETVPADLPLTLVFTYPTARELARYLEDAVSPGEDDLDELVAALADLPPEELDRLLGDSGDVSAT